MKSLALSLSLSCSHEQHSDLNEQIRCLLKMKVPGASIYNENIQIKDSSYKVLHIVHTGEYGQIASCTKEGFDTSLYWKFSPKRKRKLFKEAILQVLAHAALKAHGMAWAVPEIENIFEHPEHGIGFLMNHSTDADIFANYLQKNFNWQMACDENDKMIIEILSQIAIYLCILEDTLQFNHRDMKSTNVVLIEKAIKPFSLGYFRKGKRIVLNTHLRAILVDFGFACIPFDDKIIAAGDYLPTFDGCPKDGRDFFLLLTHLWNVEAVRKCLTPKLQEWFKKRIQTPHLSWADYLIRIKDRTLKAAYLYTTSDQFSAPECSSGIVLESLAAEFPKIVRIV